MHHRLQDFGLERQHAFDALRRDIVALVVDDDVLLAVGDDQPALAVDLADIAGMKPAVVPHAPGIGFVAPIALHPQLALHTYCAVVGAAERSVLPWRDSRAHA